MSYQRSAQGPDRLPGGPPSGEDRPLRGPAQQLYRAQQSRPLTIFRGRAKVYRDSSLPGRGQRFDPQRRRRLCWASAEPVRAPGGGSFYIALAGEPDRTRVLKMIREHLKPEQRIFIGVVSPIDPQVENPKESATEF